MKSKKIPLSGDRTLEQIRNHYEVERAIATRLKQATREERKVIYRTMYDELFRRVPDHPRLTRREDPEVTALKNEGKLKLVAKFITDSTVFVEFGPGDCRFAMDMCSHVGFVYAVDISDQSGQCNVSPSNFELVVYDGYNLEIQENSADVVFSDQLVEHLHPDDIDLHFQLVRRILKPQGVYVFRTPHRFLGPHDVSGYFSDEAEGFHLKEWTYREIAEILKISEYSSWSGYRCVKGVPIKLPFIYFSILESILGIFPKRLRGVACRYLFPCLVIEAIK